MSSVPLLLMDFLKERFPRSSLKERRFWISSGAVLVEGKVILKHDYIVLPKEEVVVKEVIPFEHALSKEVTLIYQDKDFFVVDKPPHVKVDDAEWFSLLEEEARAPLFLLHRLDQGTSGVLVLTKSIETKRLLIEDFRQFKVEKIYQAVVEGVWKKKRGKIDLPLSSGVSKGKEDKRSKRVFVDPGGKTAVTRFSFEGLTEKGEASRLLFFPVTGRTHQIRVHAAHMGHPICGDFIYGATSSCNGRLMLHSQTFKCTHPKTQEKITFHSPLSLW